MNQEIIFKEKQQFRQWWIWLVVVFVAADSIWIVVKELTSSNSFSFEHNILPLFWLLLPAALVVFMFIIKLETEVRTDGIYVRFFPIHKRFRFYAWAEMEQAYVRKYSPLAEYGGWGLRGLGNNRALNISGNKGLQLIMKGGLKLLIGTRKPEEITNALAASGAPKQILQS